MTNIPNTEFLTIKSDGFFVGGQLATQYRGVKIGGCETIQNSFKKIQEKYPNVQEVRVLTSETNGEYGKTGNPVAENGDNAWASIKFNDGYASPWNLISKNCKYDYFVSREMTRSLHTVADNHVHLQPLLGQYKDVFIRVNLQNMAGKSFEINGYRFTVEKIAQKTR
ncbi:MAG: hypothetical protein IKZ34_01370 [Alphaproteobacteria bacterium]|nr:hypothetical protein [Alphaproteobacteria bacterium]